MAGIPDFRPPHIEAEGIIFRSAKLDASSSTICLFDPLRELPSSQSSLEALGFRRIESPQEDPLPLSFSEMNFPEIPYHLKSPSAYVERREWAQRTMDRMDRKAMLSAVGLRQARGPKVYYEYTGPRAEEFYAAFVNDHNNQSPEQR